MQFARVTQRIASWRLASRLASSTRATARVPKTAALNASARTIFTQRSFHLPSARAAVTQIVPIVGETRSYRYFSAELPSHVQLEMPALSPSMEAGNLVSWNINEGDSFVAGDVIAEIETDKAVMAWEATDDGILAKILVPGGTENISIGKIVAIVVEEEADVAAFKDYVHEEGDSAASAAAPSDPPPPADEEASAAPSVTPVSVVPPPPIIGEGGERIIASPRARRLARESNVDLAGVKGTGGGGRITESDVKAASSSAGSTAPPAAASATPSAVTPPTTVRVSDEGEYTDTAVTNIRKVIAKRLLESKNTIPHYYLTSDMQVDNLLSLRQELNSRANGAYKISVNDFVIKAAALSLKKVPDVNSAWMGDQIRRFHNVHINVAVSTDNGLYSPMIANVQSKGLVDINNSVADLATKARANKLHANELQSGTFTISNLGMFGIKNFTAVINPPQACILACGGVEKRVIPDGDEFAVANYMTVTLSCDHRVVDGAVGAQWLQHFKSYIEEPVNMLL